MIFNQKYIIDNKEELEIIVQDNGIGMEKEFQNDLFKPFEQEKGTISGNKEGTGLGLAIVYNLVQLMNGTIHVWSEKGKGTKFTVKINLEYAEFLEEKLENNKLGIKKIDLSGKRVLLVEDNELNMEIAQTILEMDKILVETAENGKIAVEKFKNSQIGYYQMVLMDIRMPIMDGYEATKEIRDSQHPDAKNIPIIAMSANAYEEDVKESFRYGMNGHIPKPFDVKEFNSILEKYLK